WVQDGRGDCQENWSRTHHRWDRLRPDGYRVSYRLPRVGDQRDACAWRHSARARSDVQSESGEIAGAAITRRNRVDASNSSEPSIMAGRNGRANKGHAGFNVGESQMRCRNKLVASLSMVIAVSVTSAVAQQSAINGSQGKAQRQGSLEWTLKVNETRGPVRAADLSSRLGKEISSEILGGPTNGADAAYLI